MAILLMGVSGCGKTTIGQSLAENLNCKFYDADDYHSIENKNKMAAGVPLTDEDRTPWLESLSQLIRSDTQSVVGCSALKRRYREILSVNSDFRVVYLKGDYDLIKLRLLERRGHYFKSEMLNSQFKDLEEPHDDEGAVVVSINNSVENVVLGIITALKKD